MMQKPQPTRIRRRRRRPFLAMAAAAACAWLPGCAAVTNPVANGIPVRMLPEELLGESREGFETIPLQYLRQRPPDPYRLAPGDTLAIYIGGVIGAEEVPPPVTIPDTAELPPATGYPIVVRADGKISLPIVGLVDVAGLTIEEAEQKVDVAFTQKGEEILRPDLKRIVVSLMRPRSVRVLVVREDSAQQQLQYRSESLLGLGATETTIGGGRRSVGQILELPAYENDVLSALARTGGLPGLESTREVLIQRGYWDGKADANGQPAFDAGGVPAGDVQDRPRVTRIPLRIKPGEKLNFTPEDIILQNGDIVTVQGRDPIFYYTGGLLPAGEYPLPMDYDLTVVEAVLKSRGPLLNGGLNASNLSGALVGFGLANPSPNLLSVLRQAPNGQQVTIRVDLDEAVRDPRQNLLVQGGDILILQEVPDQAITRYFTQILRADLFFRWIDRGDVQGTAQGFVP
jgi:protein involved in polysaccharide export with SLBB domain